MAITSGSIAAPQLDAIRAVSAAVTQGAALSETLDKIAETAAELVSAQAAAIILRESEAAANLALVGSHGLGAQYAEFLRATRPLEIGEGPSGLAASTNRPVCIGDVFADDLFGPWRPLALREHYRAMISVPLRLDDDRVIGVLNAYRAEPGEWAPGDVDLVSLLADHAAIAIRTANLLDASRRQVDGLSLMVRSLRAQAHEHANRLHAIYGLLVLDEAAEAKRLIASVEEGYHSVYGAVSGRIRNPTVAGLLVAESTLARESGIAIDLDLRSRLEELPPRLSDLDAVTVLGNLLHNAVEAVAEMPRSRRRVRVSLHQRHGETLFAVRDWGPGIPEAHLSHVAEREFSTKPGHAGVGLHLVSSVVRRTGGSITFAEHLSKGAEVTIRYTT